MTTIYSATLSLDGFIAGPGGDMSWLAPHVGSSNPTADRLLAETGCLLVGRKTYFGDDPNAGTDAEGAFGGLYDGPVVVLSRSVSSVPDGAPVFADPARAVEEATRLAGDRYVNVLGAHAARSCLDLGLLDEVLFFYAPVLLGDGIRALDRPGHAPVELVRKPGESEQWLRVAERAVEGGDVRGEGRS